MRECWVRVQITPGPPDRVEDGKRKGGKIHLQTPPLSIEPRLLDDRLVLRSVVAGKELPFVEKDLRAGVQVQRDASR